MTTPCHTLIHAGEDTAARRQGQERVEHPQLALPHSPPAGAGQMPSTHCPGEPQPWGRARPPSLGAPLSSKELALGWSPAHSHLGQ